MMVTADCDLSVIRVQLRSGGPVMRVRGLCHEGCCLWCVWAEGGYVFQRSVKRERLMLVTSGAG